jgi:rubrerythrin
MLGASAQAAGADSGAYPKTIEALQARYVDEVTAHQKYHAYALRAEEEDHPNVAHLFRALAASEAVHARNFKTLLGQLGAEVPRPDVKFEVTNTQDHLQRATAVEADEIDREYPAILEKIRPEGHEEAIRFITYAWQAEKQHRDLIVKIQKASKRWFNFLVEHIEAEHAHYYVCDVCGSTLTEIPAACPICAHDASHYSEVAGFPVGRGGGEEEEAY